MAWCGRNEAPVSRATLERLIRETGGVESTDLFERWLAPRGTLPPGRPRPEEKVP